MHGHIGQIKPAVI